MPINVYHAEIFNFVKLLSEVKLLFTIYNVSRERLVPHLASMHPMALRSLLKIIAPLIARFPYILSYIIHAWLLSRVSITEKLFREKTYLWIQYEKNTWNLKRRGTRIIIYWTRRYERLVFRTFLKFYGDFLNLPNYFADKLRIRVPRTIYKSKNTTTLLRANVHKYTKTIFYRK